MTLEDRLNELETAIQAIRRDMRKEQRKFKIGDEVLVKAKVASIDEKDNEGLPYLLELLGGDDNYQHWFPESSMQPKAP